MRLGGKNHSCCFSSGEQFAGIVGGYAMMAGYKNKGKRQLGKIIVSENIFPRQEAGNGIRALKGHF
jgi:hypothetical protein